MFVLLKRLARFRACRARLALTASLAFLGANAAMAQSVFYDFESMPNSHGPAGNPDGHNPVFVNDEPAFTLSHESTGFDIAQWTNDSRAQPTHSGSGSMRLTLNAPGQAAVTATIRFSRPVTDLTLWVNTFEGSSGTITPLGLSGEELSDPDSISTNGIYQSYSPFLDGAEMCGLVMTATAVNIFYWDDLELGLAESDSQCEEFNEAPPDPTLTTLRGEPTGEGERTFINQDSVIMAATNIVVPGIFDLDVCVGKDPRWVKKKIGTKFFDVFIPRILLPRELAGSGSCQGPLEPGSTGLPQFANWLALLSAVEDVILPRYMSYKGKFCDSEAVPSCVTEEGYWLQITAFRTTAQFAGVNGLETPPLIDYSDTPANQRPGCNVDINFRERMLGSPVPAFGDYEDQKGFLLDETAQCNQVKGMIRRSFHAGPVRYVSNVLTEIASIVTQLDTTRLNIDDAAACISDGDEQNLRFWLRRGSEALLRHDYQTAINAFLDGARAAQAADFAACPVEANFEGGLVANFVQVAFTTHDRLLHRDVYDRFEVPADLNLPLLVTDEVPIP